MLQIHAGIRDYNESKLERYEKHTDFFICPQNTGSLKQRPVGDYRFISPNDLLKTHRDGKISVLSFNRPSMSVYLELPYLKKILDVCRKDAANILIDIVLWCVDCNLTLRTQTGLSLNQASLKSFMTQSEIFFDEINCIFYFTYCDKNGHLHIVWLEKKESLEPKLELIEKAGCRGIFIRDMNLALESNWDILYRLKGKSTELKGFFG